MLSSIELMIWSIGIVVGALLCGVGATDGELLPIALGGTQMLVSMAMLSMNDGEP